MFDFAVLTLNSSLSFGIKEINLILLWYNYNKIKLKESQNKC